MVGIDLLEIPRFGEAVKKWGDKFLKRIFTERELASFVSFDQKVLAELAARYAGKEAVSKVLGTGLKLMGSKAGIGVLWHDIEILNKASGQPVVMLSGRAKNRAGELGLQEIHVSLSHTTTLSAAVAFGEKKP